MEDEKKAIEKEILFSVYRREFIENLTTDSETPDFIITDKRNRKIGVEITRIFPSKTSSLLWKNDKLMDQLIRNHVSPKKQKKRSKSLKNIKIVKIEGSEDKIEFGHAIVFHQTLGEFLSFFEEVIKKKSTSYEHLPHDLHFVCLIARDEQEYLKFIGMPLEKFYGFLRQFPIFNMIISSNFHEINLLASFKSGKYHLQLLWLIFLGEFNTFSKFWFSKIIIQENQKTNLNFISNLIICLLNLGFKNLYLASDRGERIIIIGTKYIRINLKEGTFKEESFLALEISNLLKAEEAYKNFNYYQDLFEKYLEFRKENVAILNSGYFNKISD